VFPFTAPPPIRPLLTSDYPGKRLSAARFSPSSKSTPISLLQRQVAVTVMRFKGLDPHMDISSLTVSNSQNHFFPFKYIVGEILQVWRLASPPTPSCSARSRLPICFPPFFSGGVSRLWRDRVSCSLGNGPPRMIVLDPILIGLILTIVIGPLPQPL